MGIFSSLFGWGDKPAQTTGYRMAEFPDDLRPQLEKIRDAYDTSYERRMEEGYVPYTGKTIADFTPEEQAAFGGLEGLVGSQAEGFKDAAARYNEAARGYQVDNIGGLDPRERIDRRFGDIDFEGGPESFTSDRFQEKDISEYMSPYQRAVTDIEKRKAKEAFDKMMPEFERKAIAAGGMSGLGSRAGVAEGELRKKQAELQTDIESRGLQAAYADAQKQKARDFQKFQDQRAFEERQRDFKKGEREFQRGERKFDVGERRFRYDFDKGERDFAKGERTFEAEQFRKDREAMRNLGKDISGLTGKRFGSQLAEYGLLSDIGKQKRDMAQAGYDEGYHKWRTAREFPETQLAKFQSGIYGNPIMAQPSYKSGGDSRKFQPGMGRTLMGLGMSYLLPGMGGMFGGGMAGGGRLSGLSSLNQATPYIDYVKRHTGGNKKPVVYRQRGSSVFRPTLHGGQYFDPRQDLQSYLGESTAAALGTGSQGLEGLKRLDSPQDPREAALLAQIVNDKKEELGNSLDLDAMDTDATPVTIPPLSSSTSDTKKIRGFQDIAELGIKDLKSPSTIVKNLEENTRQDTEQHLQAMKDAETTRTKEEKEVYDTYKNNIEKLNLNPYAEQQFRATILAETLKEGNPIANALTGYKKALDNLSMDEEKKRKNLMALEDKLLAQKDKSSQRKLTQELNRLKINASMKEYIRGLPAKQQEMALTLIKESAAGISSLAKLKKAMKSGYSLKPSDTLARWTNYLTANFKGFATNDKGNIVVDQEFYGPDTAEIKKKVTEVLAAADIMNTRGASAGQVSGAMANQLTAIYKDFLTKKAEREEEGS